MTAVPIAVALIIAATVVGCADTRGTVPPFRERTYGPGLETHTPGRKLELVTHDGTVLARWRVSMAGVRIYAPDARRIGRVGPALVGWSLTRADGRQICALESTDTGFSADCTELVDFAGTATDSGWTITRDGAEWLRIDLNDDRATIFLGSSPESYAESTDRRVRSPLGEATPRGWQWTPASRVAAVVPVDGLDEDDVLLVRAALAWLVSGAAPAPLEPGSE